MNQCEVVRQHGPLGLDAQGWFCEHCGERFVEASKLERSLQRESLVGEDVAALKYARGRIVDLESRLDEQSKLAQGYYNEASEGWTKFREAERTIKDLTSRLDSSRNYSIALQRAIEYRCRGEDVPANIAADCPHHAAMLNAERLTTVGRLDEREQQLGEATGAIETLEREVAEYARWFRDHAEIIKPYNTVGYSFGSFGVVEKHSPNSNDGHDWTVNEPGTLYVCSGCGQTRPRV